MSVRLTRRQTLALTSAVALANLSATSAIASTYPDRAIKLLIPFSAGSGTDVTARLMSQEIGKLAGQPLIVENKPGANGFIATEMAAKATPDGYTLFLTSNTHIANKFLFKKLPYEPVADFRGVGMFRKPTPLVLVVGANSPYKTLADLQKAMANQPGKLSYASGNSSSRVGAEMFSQLVNSKMLYVPFKSNPAGLNEVAGGRVDMMFADLGAAKTLFQAGKVRALALTGPDRLTSYPNVPTAAEAGLSELDIGSWGMFLVPRKTPDAIVTQLNAWINEAIKQPAVVRYLAENDGIAWPSNEQEQERFMHSELQKWGSIIEKASIQPE